MTTFKTSDLPLATTLFTLGHQIVRLEKAGPRRIEMVFQDSESLQELVREFWSDRITVEPKKLLVHQKLLKTRLYDASK